MDITGFGSFLKDMPKAKIKTKQPAEKRITSTDTEFAVNGTTYTERRWFHVDGEFMRGDLFVGGWRKAQYKTVAGLDRAVAKIKNGE